MKKISLVLFFLWGALASFAQKKIIKTDLAPISASPYSQAVEANGFIFVSGQIATDPKTKQIVKGGIEAETTQVMENIKAILVAAGATMDDVVNATVYLKNVADFQKMNEVYRSYFKGNYPARATIGVGAFMGDFNIEIAVIAIKPPKRK